MARSEQYEAVWNDIDAVAAAWLGEDFLTTDEGLRRSLVWDHHVPSAEELRPLAEALARLTGVGADQLANRLHRRFAS